MHRCVYGHHVWLLTVKYWIWVRIIWTSSLNFFFSPIQLLQEHHNRILLNNEITAVADLSLHIHQPPHWRACWFLSWWDPDIAPGQLKNPLWVPHCLSWLSTGWSHDRWVGYPCRCACQSACWDQQPMKEIHSVMRSEHLYSLTWGFFNT